MKLETVKIEKPAEVNLVFGQSHFIKTVEDLHEAMATSAPGAKFGLAFCEASGDRLLRHSGNDRELEKLAVDNLEALGAGHTFLIFMKDVFPLNVLRAIREVPEVCGIFCATANAVEVVLAVTDLGRGVLGVIDGETPLGVEGDSATAERKSFLRRIGYKLG